jgi:hypothetical protein
LFHFGLAYVLATQGTDKIELDFSKAISAILCHECKDRSELQQFMIVRGVLTEKALATQPKGRISYRQLPSKRFCVAFWGKEFYDKLQAKIAFFSSLHRVMQVGKPIQLQDLSGSEKSAMTDFITMSTGADPDDGTMLAVGTTTQDVYENHGQRIFMERTSSTAALDPKLFKGLPSKMVSNEEIRSLFERKGDLFTLQESSDITFSPWANNLDGGMETDAGEAVKYYIEQRRILWQPLREVLQQIVETSRERPIFPEPKKRTPEEQTRVDAYNEKQKRATGRKYATPDEMIKDSKFLGQVRHIDVGIMISIQGKIQRLGRSFQLTSIWNSVKKQSKS